MKEQMLKKRIKAFGEGLSPQYQFVKGGSMIVQLQKDKSNTSGQHQQMGAGP